MLCKYIFDKIHEIPSKILCKIDHKNPYFAFDQIIAQF